MSTSRLPITKRRWYQVQYDLATLLWLTFAAAVVCSAFRTWGETALECVLGAVVGLCLPLLIFGPTIIALVTCLCSGITATKRFLLGVTLI